MTVVIVTIFFLCGAPFHIIETLFNFWDFKQVPGEVYGVMGAMAVLNNAVNPFIFLAFNVNCQGVLPKSSKRNEKTGLYGTTSAGRTESTRATVKYAGIELVPVQAETPGGRSAGSGKPGSSDYTLLSQKSSPSPAECGDIHCPGNAKGRRY